MEIVRGLPTEDPKTALLARVGPGRPNPQVYLVTRDLPELGIHCGDGLVFAPYPCYRPSHFNRSIIRELAVTDYEALRTAAVVATRQDVTFVRLVGGWQNEEGAMGLTWFLRDRRRWGLRRKAFESCILHVRPLLSTVSEPITAPTDDGALFELLASLGCRMPPVA